MTVFLTTLSLGLLTLVEGPAPEDVKAGWLGFSVFLALVAALVLLGFSLRKHLRRVDFEEPERADRSGSKPPG